MPRLTEEKANESANGNGFLEDYRISNPQLHFLHVKFAVEVLTEIDRCILRLLQLEKVESECIAEVLTMERQRLLNESAAYFDANEILKIVSRVKENKPE